ncbi:TIGR04222 domain-containing membrane protein [Leptolyngbya sp. FACHB-261]|uniref:TIGR04222 domain-containing membrane protein n=1 Tax=Leptolyngbya sp. FACHB-261 TaxID=2692806 RepID=UPI00168A1B16|nr:TIGR04222 domain-containing membrane protein [Leptolyngbya sp. FACHB-261]MBD2100181.1 TIGR04222 domain-containing membrane protein [Leptolyngbya sp. FACHB-261]
MNSQQIELYKRIQAFSLDQPDTQLSFSKRLARDNGWSLGYAQRVIEEYKKFTFLAVVAGHPVTPSDQVDQVWHLHLSYTRSYWQEFCPKVLQTPLHHDPTRGGSSEQLKFDDWYSRTLESYKQFFDQIPPIDIWSDPKDRFGRDLHFVRVNTEQNWLVPKLSLSCLPRVQHKQAVILCLLFTLASVVTGCQIVSIIPNPLNFTGSKFINFYFQLSTIVIFLASRLRAYLRLPYGNLVQQPVPLDPYEAAYLAEGKYRAVDTAIVNLVQKGYVTVQRAQRTLTLKRSVGDFSHPVEQAVANAIASDGRIDKVRNVVTQAIDVIWDRLRQLELLVNQNQASKAQTYPAILIACLLGLGIAKILVGLSRGKPIGYLFMMCIVVAVIGLGFWQIPPHRSRYGDRVLRDLRTRVRSTAVSHTDPQLPLVFALFGMAILPNDMFADLKQIFPPVPTSDGGGGGSFGDGGGGGSCGGGGGGGCGGCGGCGSG